mgnify:CR=1 FL=1
MITGIQENEENQFEIVDELNEFQFNDSIDSEQMENKNESLRESYDKRKKF